MKRQSERGGQRPQIGNVAHDRDHPLVAIGADEATSHKAGDQIRPLDRLAFHPQYDAKQGDLIRAQRSLYAQAESDLSSMFHLSQGVAACVGHKPHGRMPINEAVEIEDEDVFGGQSVLPSVALDHPQRRQLTRRKVVEAHASPTHQSSTGGVRQNSLTVRGTGVGRRETHLLGDRA